MTSLNKNEQNAESTTNKNGTVLQHYAELLFAGLLAQATSMLGVHTYDSSQSYLETHYSLRFAFYFQIDDPGYFRRQRPARGRALITLRNH